MSQGYVHTNGLGTVLPLASPAKGIGGDMGTGPKTPQRKQRKSSFCRTPPLVWVFLAIVLTGSYWLYKATGIRTRAEKFSISTLTDEWWHRPKTSFRFHDPEIAQMTLAAVSINKRSPLSLHDPIDLEKDPRAVQLTAIARRFLAPWLPIEGDPTGVFNDRMIDADIRQAVRNQTATYVFALVRIVNGKLFVRYPIGPFDKWWHRLRVSMTVGWIKSAMTLYPDIFRDMKVECAINVVDPPVSYDSKMQPDNQQAGLPIFSPAASGLHVDIAIPDAVDLAPGYIVEPELRNTLLPWKKRLPKAFHAGAPRSYNTYRTNIGPNSRLRLKVYSMINSSLIDVVFHKWHMMDKATIAHLVSHNITLSAPVNSTVRVSYQYIILPAGVIHSSSVCAALSAAQVTLLQDMGFQEYFYPALEDWKHFVAVRKPLDNVVELLEYLVGHESVGARISEAAYDASRLFCTDEGRALYWAILLKEWSKITLVDSDLVEPAVCGHEQPTGYKGPEDLPSCNDLSPEDRIALEQLEHQTCHHRCIPSTASSENFLWVEIL